MKGVRGLLSLTVFACLLAAYVLLPQLTSKMSILGKVGFRTLIAMFAAYGVIQILSARTRESGAIASPGFGRHRMILHSEGIVYLVIMFVLFTGAMLTRSNMLMLVFALMVGPFVINGWLTFGMLRAARVARTAPQRAMAGELFNVDVTLTNSRPIVSIWIMTVSDEIRQQTELLTATVLFSRVSPRSSQTGHYQLRMNRRGKCELGPLLISSRFPLGLVERTRMFPTEGEILIYPRIGRLAPSWRRRWQGATELVARPQPRTGIFHDEFHRLREFRTGDNPRDIHWRSSARRGELILREYQQNRDYNLVLVVDLWEPAIKSESFAKRIELTLSFVATTVVEYGRSCRDAVISVYVSGMTTFRWQGQGTSSHLHSLFDDLAVIQGGRAPQSAELLDEAIHTTPVSTHIVLISTRPENEIPDNLNQMNSRVELVCLTEAILETSLIFDDEPVTVAVDETQN